MKLMALVYFVLSLYGCDIGGSNHVTRTTVDGTDVLYSQTTTRAGVARFECLRSASGACYYTVLPRECGTISPLANPQTEPCASEAIKHFTVPNGESRQITGLAGFNLCVSQDDDAIGILCDASSRL